MRKSGTSEVRRKIEKNSPCRREIYRVVAPLSRSDATTVHIQDRLQFPPVKRYDRRAAGYCPGRVLARGGGRRRSPGNPGPFARKTDNLPACSIKIAVGQPRLLCSMIAHRLTGRKGVRASEFTFLPPLGRTPAALGSEIAIVASKARFNRFPGFRQPPSPPGGRHGPGRAAGSESPAATGMQARCRAVRAAAHRGRG